MTSHSLALPSMATTTGGNFQVPTRAPGSLAQAPYGGSVSQAWSSDTAQIKSALRPTGTGMGSREGWSFATQASPVYLLPDEESAPNDVLNKDSTQGVTSQLRFKRESHTTDNAAGERGAGDGTAWPWVFLGILGGSSVAFGAGALIAHNREPVVTYCRESLSPSVLRKKWFGPKATESAGPDLELRDHSSSITNVDRLPHQVNESSRCVPAIESQAVLPENRTHGSKSKFSAIREKLGFGAKVTKSPESANNEHPGSNNTAVDQEDFGPFVFPTPPASGSETATLASRPSIDAGTAAYPQSFV